MATYLDRRSNGFRFQIAIPADLWPRIGKSPIRILLGKVDAPAARRAARLLSGHAETLFTFVRNGATDHMETSDAKQHLTDELLTMLEETLANGARIDEMSERRVRQAVELTELKLLGAELERQKALGDKLKSLGGQINKLRDTVRDGVGKQIPSRDDLATMLANLSQQVSQLSGDVRLSLDGGPERPKLSEVLPVWTELRKGQGVQDTKWKTDHNRIGDFLEFAGDKPLNKYTYFDFQRWANLLVRVPKDSDKKPEIRNMSREAAADYNETLPPKSRYTTLTEKTIDTSYLSPLRMIFKDMAAEHQFVYPLSDVEVWISPNATQSKERIPFDVEKLNTWFAAAAAEPTADKQWLPLLGSITGARIGELVFLQGKDVYEMQAKNGKRYWVLDLQTPIVVGEEEKKRQIKNPGSRRLIALHEVFEEVGFLDYVRTRVDEEWIFPAAHYDPRKRKPTEDPADAASKRMNRMLKGLGIHEEQTQVFHSTRHSAKELMRLAKVEKRTHDKQTGHAFADQSDQYGSKKLVAEEIEVLASLPLPEGLDLKPYLTAKVRRGRQ